MSGPLLPDALYYLRNFLQAIAWVTDRNDALLSASERAFSAQLNALPVPAQALLARLSMRRGALFRRSRICYAEIESLDDALDALIDIGWLDPRPALTLSELFHLATRAELAQRFPEARRLTKQAAYEMLCEQHTDERAFEQWLQTNEPVVRVNIAPTVLAFRLLHFGNFYQQWHEYTLAHLQIFKYEPVALAIDSRPFEVREDIEFFYALYHCHESLNEGAELGEVLALLPAAPAGPAWLRRQWDRLRYHLGHQAEREDAPDTALQLYRDNAQPEARVREVRLLECLKRDEEAIHRARALLNETSSEFIQQRVGRILARLARRGGVTTSTRKTRSAWSSIELQLPHDPARRVEFLVQAHLSRADAPVHYVENSLVGSLFGLLCWEAIFAPLPGAFFHPFQSRPADLSCADFVARRRDHFEACLRRLDTGEYPVSIVRMFAQKYGTRAPFVHWQALDAPMLALALECIPAAHLKLYFARLLDDLSENATGFPDLVQFFPGARTYKLIEVKGPGDHVQDNQRRWLQYCVRHQLPVEVCHVQWRTPQIVPCLATQAGRDLGSTL